MKYRLYDKQRNKMIYPETETQEGYNIEIYMDGSFSVERKYEKEGIGYRWWVEKSSKFILMRSIDLTDKNDKEIYKNDILDMDGLCFVIWKDGAYWVESPGSKAQDLPSSQDFEKSIVMGNIHENSINDYWKTNEN